jgi:formylglycine-generating enzyme required for sulfatase activity
VQQFIKGQTLKQELEQQGTFSEAKIRELLLDLLPILQFVHERKVIHRDIKPENVIRRESDQKFILIDFGVAKQWSGTLLSQQGTMTGTPGYAPIEQLRGIAYPASDLYSLGVTCICLLTGYLPSFDGSFALYDAFEGCWLWREKLPRGITVSAELGELLDKLLQDLARDRYRSAVEVLGVLNRQGSSPSQPTAVAPTILSIPQPPSRKATGLQTFDFDVVSVNAQGKETNRRRNSAQFFSEDLGNGINLEMVSIPGGSFIMGSPDSEQGRRDWESPQHSATIQSFYMGKFTITQAQWRQVAALPQIKTFLNSGPSGFKGNNLPVEQVSWNEAVEFCARLSQKTGKDYRLPSEAEWEYACRAETTTPFYFGKTITPKLVNYDGNYTYGNALAGTYRGKTTPVGSFQVANAFGLYDMHGNVWEWCADHWYDSYQRAPNDGSIWLSSNEYSVRVVRGGSWNSFPRNCRSACRNNNADYRSNVIGFRVVCCAPRTL